MAILTQTAPHKFVHVVILVIRRDKLNSSLSSQIFIFCMRTGSLIQISDWLKVYPDPRTHDYIGHALQLERLRSRSGRELQATEYLYLKSENV